MAFSLFTSFSLHCQARPNNNPTRNRPTPKRVSKRKQKPNTPQLKSGEFRSPSPVSAATGDTATTYTRLPPKDDFFLPPLYNSAEITLSESTAATSAENLEQNIESFDHMNVKNLKFDYGKFELYEVNDENDDVASVMEGSRSGKFKLCEVNDEFDDEGEDLFDENDDVASEREGSRSGKFKLYEVNDEFEDEGGDLFDENDDVASVMKDSRSGKFELYEVNDEFDDEVSEMEGSGSGVIEGDVFEGEGSDIKEKEKGVPAVMRCFDRAKIFVKAGDGGNGVVAFRREKFVPMGGPSGGDGGRGGNVYVEVDESMNSLLPFRQSVHYKAGRGGHGHGKKQFGPKGEDVVVKVPPGTVVREAGEGGIPGEILFELLHPGQRALLLPGGRGGRGNASFKAGSNRVPKIAENGEEGAEMWLELELKLVADVGIVGAPNAGKSTFLSVISAAQPAIANYPFTTLLPNLGVVSFDYDATVVVADLPGLLEGAHRGFGLGHEFLRHSERCTVLVHVVDGSSPQPEYEFDAVRLELEMFSPELAEKPYLVVYNKMDLPDAYENWRSFRDSLRSSGIEPFCMSAVQREGTHEVICAAYELVRRKKEVAKEEVRMDQVNLNYVAEMVKKQRNAPISEFEISHDSSSNTWYVEGSGLRRFVQMTNWRYMDSDRRFQHVLEACGVFKSLLKHGVKEGDTVVVGDMELVWHDSDNSGPTSRKKWAAEPSQ